MGRWAKDLSGKKFNMLTVINRADDYVSPRGHLSVQWNCQCECGNYTVTRGTRLKSGHTKSCGCYASADNRGSTIHGLCHTKIYGIWLGMKQRCLNPNSSNFKSYGGRGIRICDEWKDDPVAFNEWATNNGFAENLTIDRIDVNGNYTPENCRWITNHEQQFNKRSSHYIVFRGEKMTVAEFSYKTGINYDKARKRLKKGYTPSEIYEELKA